MSILLRRFMPLNWHTLWDCEPLKVGDSCFITGLNGSGKSTMIDALQMVAMVKTNRFNKATSAESSDKRTVRDYVRGLRTLGNDTEGTGAKTYWRPGATVTHIVSEWYNTKTKKSFLLGSTVEMKDVRESDDPKMLWWAVPDAQISDFVFHVPLAGGKKRLAKLAEIKAMNPSASRMQIFDTQVAARRAFSSKQYLHLSESSMGDAAAFSNWSDIMVDSIAFNPANFKNPHEFIRDFMVPRFVIDTDAFMELCGQMGKLIDTVDLMSRRRDALGAINTTYHEYFSMESRYRILKTASLSARVKALEKQLNDQGDIYLRCQSKVNSLASQIKAIDEEREKLNEAIYKAEHENENGYVADLKRSLQTKNAEMEELDTLYRQFQQGLKAARQFAAQVNLLVGEDLVPMNHIVDLENQEYLCDDALMFQLKKALEQAFSKCQAKLQEMERASLETQRKLSALTDELQSLSGSVGAVGDAAHRAVKDAIQQAFVKHGVQDRPYSLCELLEWKDDSWAEPAEAYMGSSRYAIIVSPKNYKLAAYAYQEYCHHHAGTYGVNLIDTTYYDGKVFGADEGSLAQVFEPANDLVSAYINDTYGRVILVEDASVPADKNRVSIDKGGMRYARHSYSRMRPVDHLVIGQAAREARIQWLTSAKEGAIKDWEAAKKTAADCEALVKEFNLSVNPFTVNGGSHLERFRGIPRLHRQIVEDEKALEKYESRPELVETKKLRQRCDQLAVERSRLDEESRNRYAEMKAAGEAYTSLQEERNSVEEELEAIERDNQPLWKQAEEEVELRVQMTRRGYTRIRDDILTESTLLKDSMAQKNGELVSLQRDYTRSFNMDYPCMGFTSIHFYQDDYDRINSSLLPNNQQQLSIMSDKVWRRFQEDLLAKLAAGYHEGERSLKAVNKILRKVVFNGRFYQFDTIKPATGMREMFEMLSSVNNVPFTDDQMSFEKIAFEDDFASTRERLFKELTDPNNPNQETLLDWRTYCQFGVTCYDANDPTYRADLSKLFGHNSGGENQVPCYILMAAALLHHYNKSNHNKEAFNESDSCRLMIIDECFDKMDSKNCRQMVEFLKQELGLQVIIAAPNDKFSNVAESLDSVWLMLDKSAVGIRDCQYFTREQFRIEETKAGHRADV